MAQASQAQIYQLAQAGIATHVIPDQAGVDPVFAMARARDMPDVHFAALFEKETLVLGCPNGLPDDLAPLASPIDLSAFEEAVAQTSAAAEDEAESTSTTQKKIELLADRIASLMPAPDTATPEASGLAYLEDRLAALDAKLTQIDPTAGLTQVLEAQIALQNALDQPAPPGRTDDGLRKTITQLLDDSQSRHDALVTRLADLQDAMQAVAPDASTTPDLTTAVSEIQQTLVAQSEAQHTSMMQLMTEGLAAMQATPAEADGPDLSTIQASLSVIEGHLADLTGRPAPMLDLTAQRKSFASFGTALAGTLLRFEALADRIENSSLANAAPDPSVAATQPSPDDLPPDEEPLGEEVGTAASLADLNDTGPTEPEESTVDHGSEDTAEVDQMPPAPELNAVADLAPEDQLPPTDDIEVGEPQPEEAQAETSPELSALPDADPITDDVLNITDDAEVPQAPVLGDPTPAASDSQAHDSTTIPDADETPIDTTAEGPPNHDGTIPQETGSESPTTGASDAISEDLIATPSADETAETPIEPAPDGTPDPASATPQNTTVQGLSPEDSLIGPTPPSGTVDGTPLPEPGQPQITLDDLRSLFAELIATQMREGGMPPPPGPQTQTNRADA